VLYDGSGSLYAILYAIFHIRHDEDTLQQNAQKVHLVHEESLQLSVDGKKILSILPLIERPPDFIYDYGLHTLHGSYPDFIASSRDLKYTLFPGAIFSAHWQFNR